MDDITRGGSAYKTAWAALPKERRRAISKAVQGGKAVTEETAIAIGYAARQIRFSWPGYVAIFALVVVLDDPRREMFWRVLIPAVIALVTIYSYWCLFRSRSLNEDLLFAQDDDLDDGEDDDDDDNGIEPIERLEGEGGPVSEVAVSPLTHPPTPPQPQAPPVRQTPPVPQTPPQPPPTTPDAAAEARTED